MKLTTRGRYAVTAMLDLAIRGGAGPVPLADISARQDISLSYLEQLFAKLRAHGLVTSTRGPGGGYRLSRPPLGIAIAEIIEAVDEGVAGAVCEGQYDCREARHCLTHDLWTALSQRIHDFLDGISLGELMERRGVLEVARRQRQGEIPGHRYVSLESS